ncbi:MAG: helix-turn-helix transcriptional regulator [Clostridia bacterium]|nr:helix-turn-helix transcriptional regulator [Clostridia bacterium]
MTYTFKSFSPLLEHMNRFDQNNEAWLNDLELFGFKCVVNGQGGIPKYQKHRHSGWEVHLIMEGASQFYEIEGERVTLSKGEMMLIAPNVEHVRVDLQKDLYFVKFSSFFCLPVSTKEYPRDILAIAQQHPYVKWKVPKGLREIIDFVLENVDMQNVASVGVLKHCVAIFMQLMLDSLRDVLKIEPMVKIQKKVNLGTDAEFCESVVAYMKNHPNVDLSIKDIASHFAISQRHLNRRFHAYYGKSCNDIGKQIRRDYARDLLCNTNLSVEEIAIQLGYTNAGNFIRFFKSVEGISPSNFRRDFHSAYKDHL